MALIDRTNPNQPEPTRTDPLTDRFGRRHTYLRVSVTDRCNLRCKYCMPAEGIAWIERKELLTFEEIERVVRVLAAAGVDKVRITGGEPTVRRGIEDLISAIARIDAIREIAMTTNGTTLPARAQTYRDAGLTHLNVSIDSLRADRFREITQTDKFDTVTAGIESAIAAGFAPLKINTVVMKGVNDDEIPDFVSFARTRPVNVRFIEFMPFDGNAWSSGKMSTYSEMLAAVGAELEPIERKPCAVAKDFRIVGGLGTVSFVTSMTDDFCGDCNRIRLTATGEFKPCLFMLPNVSVRDRLRSGCSDEDVLVAVQESLGAKWKGHPGPQALLRLKNASMIQIGG
jgi:cyclic pyranopterin phosphate synthase